MTSSITPQIAASLVNNKIKLPYSLRPQAHDIIRTWAFYTIFKSLFHENKIPWKNAMVSGFVTLGGEKMAKSKGNVIAPQEVIEKHCADALRFLAASSKLGEDLDYQEQDLLAGKKFLTKLFNASKFVFMNLADYDGEKPKKLEKIDELFLNKLNSIVKTATESFENYEYSRAKLEIEKFFWQDFCDNYLEIVKKRVYNEKGNRKISAQYALHKALLTLIKLFAPIMPFITEEIYQKYFKKTEKDKSVHISEWPEAEKEKGFEEFDLFTDILSKIRQEKTKAKKPMNSEIILSIDKNSKEKLKELLQDLKDVANASSVKEGEFRVEFV